MDILIIEDELLISKSLSRLLTIRGAKVETASCGSEGLKAISSRKFDRIVCDLMLQDITGFDIIEEARKFLSSESIKSTFLIMTAYSSPDVINKAATYGCPVLKKPFEDLQQTINLIMTRSSDERIQ